MILVTGATGHFGKATIDFLLQKNIPASSIAALVRDPGKAGDLENKGIGLRKGDYLGYESLVNAFKGIDKLLLVSSSEMHDRSTQHTNAIKAAKEAGVKHIVYTSFLRKKDVGSPMQMLAQGHIDAEKAIRASGMSYTIMKNSLYADLLPMFIGERVYETGILVSAGNGRTAFTTRLDMAEAAANVLKGHGHENKEYVIAADTNYSFDEVARTVSELSGKPVTYTNLSTESYVDALVKAGLPAEHAGLFAGITEAMKQGEFETGTTDLTSLLGRKPVSVREFLAATYSSNN